ncbi:MAG: hypothetical protein ACP5I8_12655 [Phycisphaerae bacterium]
MNEELDSSGPIGEPPDYLTEAEKIHWFALLDELPPGLMNRSCRRELAQYCTTFQKWLDIRVKMRGVIAVPVMKIDKKTGEERVVGLKPHALEVREQQIVRELGIMQQRFGMTPAARSAIIKDGVLCADKAAMTAAEEDRIFTPTLHIA